jgi:rSAM/selenodomain-associated transferase 2/rSAM/selenodomain-associated transferase 1
MPQPARLAIIVPTLNEGPALVQAMQALAPLRGRGALVVLCDGGSTDGSVDAAAHLVDRVVPAPRGRALQMNAGLTAVQAEAYVLLHVDTTLPEGADKLVLDALAQDRADWGRFTVRLRSNKLSLRVVQWSMNWRSRLTGICTGDQTIFFNAAMLATTGGFAPIALMEDIAFSQEARRMAWPQVLSEQVVSSARRWEKHGTASTILRMWALRLAYFLGAKPRTLARRYGYDVRATPAVHIAVLAKAPLPGLAKTRLIPGLGAFGAARVARTMLLHTLERSKALPTTLWCAPTRHARFFRALSKRCKTLPMLDQAEGDIGQRMWQAAKTHFAQAQPTPLLVVGTDCPAMRPAHWQHAAHALLDHDVVLIPAQDGGYVLIGFKAAHQAVFSGVEWSTERVMEQTCAILQREGLSYAVLATLWDVDTSADYEKLQQCWS